MSRFRLRAPLRVPRLRGAVQASGDVSALPRLALTASPLSLLGMATVSGDITIGAGASSIFPLAIHTSKRYFVDAQSTPFLLNGDTAWSILGQLTNAEITTYLTDRSEKGTTAVLFNAPEPYYTDQTPSYRNVDGNDPFNPGASFTNPVEAYWARFDHLVGSAQDFGMLCIINPAYAGYQAAAGTDGWCAQGILTLSDSTLFDFGVWLANRCNTNGFDNILWCTGGDEAGDATMRDKLAQIILGILSVRTTDHVTAHPSSGEDPYTFWSGYSWFDVNNTYCYETDAQYAYAYAATALTRTNHPFFGFEFKYENSTGATLAMLRRQVYGTLLGGGCGTIYGNLPIWNFDSARWTSESWTGTWDTHLDDTGVVEQGYAIALLDSIEWWKLAPSSSLVTSPALGSGTSRIMPALTSDGAAALVYVPSSQSITLDMTLFSPSVVNVRLFNPTTGTSTLVGSYTNTGTQVIATGGERVIVVTAATASFSWNSTGADSYEVGWDTVSHAGGDINNPELYPNVINVGTATIYTNTQGVQVYAAVRSKVGTEVGPWSAQVTLSA